MKVTLCTCADFASSDARGKLNLMGIFDSISLGEFPGTHPAMVFVVRMLFEYGDTESSHPFKVQLRGPDGEQILELGGDVRIGTIQPGTFLTRNMVFQLQGVPFKRSGTYNFRVLSKDRVLEELPLLLVKNATP